MSWQMLLDQWPCHGRRAATALLEPSVTVVLGKHQQVEQEEKREGSQAC